MIDLHTHTTYSDGRDDVITLLKKAEEKKIECLSITDHGTCKAYEELKKINIKEYYTGKLITGCELFAMINGTTIELLGYNVDTDFLNKELPKIYKYTIPEMFANRFDKMIKKCNELGIILNKEEIQYNPNTESASRAVLREIVKNEQNKKILDDKRAWENNTVFYREHISNPKSKFFTEMTENFPEPKEVIDLIRKAGGLVFIPHILIYGENSAKFLEELTKNHKIDGIECYHSAFTEEQTKYLLDFCKENSYYISGGSDYHGALKPGIDIGIGKGNLNILFETIENWI